MAAEEGKLEERVPAEQEIMGNPEAKAIMAEPEAEQIISSNNKSNSSEPADAPPCLSHPDVLPSDLQDPLMGIQGAEGGEPSDTSSFEELGPSRPIMWLIKDLGLQGFLTRATAAAMSRVAEALQGFFSLNETGRSGATQVTAGAYAMHSLPVMFGEPVQAQEGIQGMKTAIVEFQGPIAGPAKWCLNSTIPYHQTSDWSTILRRKHTCPPIRTATGASPLVDCGIVDCGCIKLSAVKFDPNAGGNWVSTGFLESQGCEFMYEGEHCLIKKGDNVIGTARMDDEGLYSVDEFDDSNLELHCPGCKVAIN